MHVLQVATQVPTLGEGLEAELARKRPHSGVFSKVISEVAALFEHASASGILTLEEKLDPLCVGIFLSDGLMPLFGDPFKRFVLISSRISYFV